MKTEHKESKKKSPNETGPAIAHEIMRWGNTTRYRDKEVW